MNALWQRCKAPMFVVEHDGHWAAALRLALDEVRVDDGRISDLEKQRPDGQLRVVELRLLDELWPALAAAPIATVALEVTADNFEQVCAALARLERRFPAVSAFALADRPMAAYSGLLQEAGAAWVVDSPREIGSICQIARRSLARHEPTESATGLAAHLPWDDVLATPHQL